MKHATHQPTKKSHPTGGLKSDPGPPDAAEKVRAAPEPKPDVVTIGPPGVTVNGKPISEAEFAERTAKEAEAAKKQADAEAKQKAADEAKRQAAQATKDAEKATKDAEAAAERAKELTKQAAELTKQASKPAKEPAVKEAA